MNSPHATATYENKAWLRENFGAELPFAQYSVYDYGALQPGQADYSRVQSSCGEIFVMQHEQLSGGKGTHIVRTPEDFDTALQRLPGSGRIVVSQYITGAVERSVQCCTLKGGVVAGDMQKQIVRNTLLCNVDALFVNGFCGAEIRSVEATAAQTATIRKCAETIDARMFQDGYKGIFGLDFMLCGEQLYLLEVNARSTGVTPLLTQTYEDGSTDIPFYALHVLELSGADYSVSDNAPALAMFVPDPAGMLILQSHEPVASRVKSIIQPGIYDASDGKIRFVRNDARFDPKDPTSTILVQNYVSAGAIVKPGNRVMTIMTRQPVLD